MSNSPSDLSYAVSLVSDIWDGIWNAVTSSWWLTAFVVLGLAGGLATIIINLVLSFQPNYRDGIGIWGLSGSLRRRIVERREEKEKEKKKQKKKELLAADEELVTIDEARYWRNRYYGSRRYRYGNYRKIDYIHTNPPPSSGRSYDVDVSVDD